MKKLITGLFAIAVFTFSANAQNQQENDQKSKIKEKHGQHHGQGHDRKGMEGLAKLNLTEAQRQQIKSINDEFKTKLQALNQNDNMMVKDAKAQRKALMEERKSKISAILTPEQRTQFEQLRKQHGQEERKMDKSEWKEKKKMKDGKEKVKVK